MNFFLFFFCQKNRKVFVQNIRTERTLSFRLVSLSELCYDSVIEIHLDIEGKQEVLGYDETERRNHQSLVRYVARR